MTYPQQMLEEMTAERDTLRARIAELEAQLAAALTFPAHKLVAAAMRGADVWYRTGAGDQLAAALARIDAAGITVRTPEKSYGVSCGKCSHETVADAVISCVVNVYGDCGAHGLFKQKMRQIEDRVWFMLDNAADYLLFCILLREDLLEFGVSLRTGWLTEKGKAVLAILEACPEEE